MDVKPADEQKDKDSFPQNKVKYVSSFEVYFFLLHAKCMVADFCQFVSSPLKSHDNMLTYRVSPFDF
jgi:hypothetical protein